MEPLGEEPLRSEAGAGGLEELAREEVRDAGDPGVRGLGHDQVEGLARAQQVVAPVAEHDPEARVALERAVELREEARGLPGRGLDLDALEPLDRVDGRGRRRGPGPQPITSTRRGPGCSSIGTCAMNFCVTTSSVPLPASVLPFTERKRRALALRLRDRHDRLAALAVEEQRPLLAEPRAEASRLVEPVDPLEPVAVHARGHDHGIPGRVARREPERRRADGGARGRAHERAAAGRGGERPGAAPDQERGEHQVGRLHAEARHQHEVGGERTRDGTGRVPRVETARGLLRTVFGAGREVQQQREREPEHDGDRQQRRQAEREVRRAGGARRRRAAARAPRARRSGAGRSPTVPPSTATPARTNSRPVSRAGWRMRLRRAAVERRPGRDAQQHRQQHQAEGVHRRADDERVGAGPQHLDAEGRGARGEREHEAQRRARRLVARRRFARGGRLARGRRGPRLAREAQRHAADEQARRRRHHQCRLHAERRHQHEGRECHSDGAAQRVQQIETPEAGVHLPPRAREELDGERHGRPEQDRRRQQDERGEEQRCRPARPRP